MEFLSPPAESPLQRELNRIEVEAAHHSALICAAAPILDSAHQLCNLLNTAADLKPGSLFASPLAPAVTYHRKRAEIGIYARHLSATVVQLALQAGLHLVKRRPFPAFEDTFIVLALEYPGVSIFVRAPHADALPLAPIAEAA